LLSSIKNQHKFYAIDSLRGIAALMVIFQHFWEMNHISDERLRPWLFFCAGHEAVILFFVLSGFVLSHQLREFQLKQYKSFLTKRFIRIYPVYYVSIVLSVVIFFYLNSYHRSSLSGLGLSDWFYIWSRTSFDFTFFSGTLTLLAHCGNSLNLSVWTLFYEMWLSLFFPIFILILRPQSGRLFILFLIMLSSLSYYLWSNGSLLQNDWCGIVYYSWYFILGALLYKWRDQAVCIWLGKNGILLIGLALYFSNYLFFGKITSRLLHEIIIAFGSSLIIISAIHNNQFKNKLAHFIVQFYGRISYSLYLVHLSVLYLVTYLLADSYGILVSKFVTIILATLIAWSSYWLIEDKFTLFLKNRFKLR